VEAGVAAVAGRRALWWVHLAFVAGLVACFVSPMLVRWLNPSSSVQTLIAILIGAAGAAAYARFEPLRSMVSVLAAAAPVFLVIYLLFSPVSAFVLNHEGHGQAGVASSNTPVVLMILDEFPTVSLLKPDGQLDRKRFPGLAGLARDATWFRNATTVHDSTTEAVPAILSGRRTRLGEKPYSIDHPDSVFSYLSRSHRMHVSEPYTDVCPRSLCTESPRSGFWARVTHLAGNAALLSAKSWLPDYLSLRLPDIHTGKRLAAGGQFSRFLAGLDRPGRPVQLNAIHLWLPHAPWVYFPSGSHYFLDAAAPFTFAGDWPTDDWLVTQQQQRHLLQAEFADHLVRELVMRLRRNREYDRSLVIVTADHGMDFTPGESPRRLTKTNAQSILPVPLFVKLPRSRGHGRVNDSLVRTTDVFPTIADVLGGPSPPRAEGLSVLDPRVRARDRVAVHSESGVPEVVLSRRTFLRRRAADVRRKVARFGPGSRSLFAIGPAPQLTGRALPSRPPDRATTAGLFTGAVVRPRPETRYEPSLVIGRLTGPQAKPGLRLAIAVNGVVRTTTWTSGAAGRAGFASLVPEWAFRRGANRIAVARIGSGAHHSLLPVRTSGLRG
jgi:hypothetical protein